MSEVLDKAKSGSRCTGHCCRDIGLTISPDQLKASYENWLARFPEKYGVTVEMSKNPDPVERYGEIHLLYPMLRFSHKDQHHPDGDANTDHDVYHYICKHLSPKGNCEIYEYRPYMCRTFGIPERGRGCGVRGCTWLESRTKFENGQKELKCEGVKDEKAERD